LGATTPLTYQVDNKISDFYMGDQVKIIQVLSNLIDNAIKFTNEGGIDVTVSLQSQNTNTHFLLFEVADTGIGITPKIRSRLFESFSQGDFSMARKYGGTGLGLAISKGLVEAMGGSIDVDASDKGSRFYFTVPMQETKPLFNRKTTSSFGALDAMATDKNEGHILVAEDNKLNQKILQIILEKSGYKVTIVSDGIEVLSALNESAYDLILMDCQMPNMDGYLTTKEIRRKELSGDKPIPIIGVTAHTLESDRDKCLESGMNEYISKPFNIDELHKLIRAYIEK
jgi:CheY-like chemotaxis protein/anti-sigma regulatory factor (Ser/Thr protein kinase)